jgi:CRP/FNR family transcriptional regulator, cyclic AMP receptor protein
MHELLAQCDDLDLVTIEPGDVLIAQGQAAGPVYVLVEGDLTIERDGAAFARVDGPGSIFGEMSALLGRPATATVRAATRSQLRRASDGEAFVAMYPVVAMHVARTVASRLDNLTQYLADVKRQFAGQSGHLGMIDDVLTVLVHHQTPPVRSGSARDPDPEY